MPKAGDTSNELAITEWTWWVTQPVPAVLIALPLVINAIPWPIAVGMVLLGFAAWFWLFALVCRFKDWREARWVDQDYIAYLEVWQEAFERLLRDDAFDPADPDGLPHELSLRSTRMLRGFGLSETMSYATCGDCKFIEDTVKDAWIDPCAKHQRQLDALV